MVDCRRGKAPEERNNGKRSRREERTQQEVTPHWEQEVQFKHVFICYALEDKEREEEDEKEERAEEEEKEEVQKEVEEEEHG